MAAAVNEAFTLSIDWEDFSQLMCRDFFGKVTPPKAAIDRQTDIILQLLDDTKRRATFFILGMLASHRPDLVKKIAAAGHEMAIHGQHHKDMRKLSRADAAADLLDSTKLVEDIIGAKVYGYRAPYFSIDESNFHVLETLAEMGMLYDSSIFPMKLRRYGIEGFDPAVKLYRLPSGREIVELPITTGEVAGRRLPVAGGGYVRLFPGFFLNKVFKKMHRSGVGPMLYMHPYEFDTCAIDCTANFEPGSVYSAKKMRVLNFKWNLFRQSIRGKLRALLERYDFVTCKEKAEYVKALAHSPGILGRSQ